MTHPTGPDHGLDFWRRELAEHQMPVFAQTARTIVQRTAEDDSSAQELSRLILQDVSMTARVLRMANSIYFNPGGGKITTISRAIVLLGFDVVRDICLSISLIDTFLRGPHREVVVAEMAHCLHAAMQARGLAKLSRQHDPEEVFIAALLFHLGTLAFWCFAGGIDDSAAVRLRAARHDGRSESSAQIEKDVLGFRLQQLTAALNKEWKLSPLLAATLDPAVPPTLRSRTVGFGHEIARALARAPGAPKLEHLLAEVARSLQVSPNELRRCVEHHAHAAADSIVRLGVPEAARLIPIAADEHVVEPSAVETVPSPGNDGQLQLEILRELTQLMLEPKADANLMLEMVLEGIYRGVGMDRAIFALLSPDRHWLRARSVLAADRDELQQRFQFAVTDPSANALAWALRDGQPMWFRHRQDIAGLQRDPELQALSGGNFFLMPLAVAGKPVGCLYADRAESGRPLTEELFTQFKLFGQQARMGLAYLKAH